MTPILYSYRRCPYAMRARMALKYAGIEVEHREIELRNKPQSMLRLSPKGTVPVLCADGLILDQSMDIIHWALMQSDPDGWGDADESLSKLWIEKNDGLFKTLLDQYKYPNRYPNLIQEEVFDAAIELMLSPMDASLQNNQYLLGDRISLVDVATFPFIRQFAMVNAQRFADLPFNALKKWLQQQVESDLFLSAMDKHPTWVDELRRA
jgi:glutathione S-transferase